MTKIKPKLYLNMSPQTQEEGSLAFARNMKVDDDGCLISDYGYNDITCKVSNDANPSVGLDTYNIVGHIVGLDNKIYFFCATGSGTTWANSKIIEYDEAANTAKKLSAKWTYSGGSISGCVNTNQSGKKILTIGEYFESGSDIPLKHINLSYCSDNDDESIYCQAPKCPTANLIIKDTYVKTIPNGVYVFFIRYKIRKDVYTNWFLCSRPIFSGTSEKINTLQGGLRYINHHKDSAKSFVLQLSFAQYSNRNSYKEFQLGFIITHDDATDARTWKHFETSDFVSGTPLDNQNIIYFDYDNVEETNIDDLLATTYELYNVKNITSFKNKLYIGNYTETDFNGSSLDDLASKITLDFSHSSSNGTADINYISGKYYRNDNETSMDYNYSLGFFNSFYNNPITGSTVRGDLSYSASKFIKGDTKIKEDIVVFDLKWDDGWKPGVTSPNDDDLVDIAVINNIHNDILHGYVYGADYSKPYNSGALGIKVIDRSIANKRVFAPDNWPGIDDYDSTAKGKSTHPWYDKDLTFIFGCINEELFGSSICKFKRTGTKYRFTSSTKKGWIADNTDLNDIRINEIHNIIKTECEQKAALVKCYLEVTYGPNTYKLQFNDDFDSDSFAVSYEDSDLYMSRYPGIIVYDANDINSDSINPPIETIVKAYLESSGSSSNGIIRGISDSGVPIVNVGTDIDPIYVPAETIAVKFKLFNYSVNYEDLGTSSDVKLYKRYKVNLETTDYTSICSVKFNPGVVRIQDNSGSYSQAQSLMPKSVYQPYIHFVDEHNIITNGIIYKTLRNGVRVPTTIETDAIYNNVDRLNLKYKVLSTIDNSKYKSFFISLVNTGDVIIEGFAYTKSNGMHILHCIELDSLLYNINDNIRVYEGNSELTNSNNLAKYYSSGESYPYIAFGNCGFVAWNVTSDVDYSTNKRLYIKITRDVSKENNKRLVKASEYIPLTPTLDNNNNIYKPVEDGFYDSYFCLVKKPDFDASSKVYVSGNDIYSVDRNASIKLSDFKNYVQVQNSKTYFIRSNFNLNYLSLTEDIADKIFTIGSAASGLKQVAKVINSAILSSIYELKGMYKDFLNKRFSEFETDNITTYNNTIRVSHVLSDETFNNSVFKFEATDYYNVPTDRGVIVNLFAIGNNIFVHTKGSLYKFDANQTIVASDSDITLQENEPFDAGISQVFDSQYGYGGIYNKEAGCITFDSYFFYDRFSNHIFAYGGSGQVQIIDSTIYKFLSYYNFKECYTLHDDANHRILFDFRTSNNYILCISYNYKAKNFISMHDISLEKAFSSRNKCYSYKSDICTLFNKGVITNIVLNENLNLLKLYGGASARGWLFFGSDKQLALDSCFNIAVIIPTTENIREVVNNIKYIGDVVKNYIKLKTAENPEDEEDYDFYDLIYNDEHTLYENNKAVNPVKSMYIITDSCLSNKILGTIDDTARPDSMKIDDREYQKIRHDIDSWNTNYFRNILHSNNVYDYPGETGANSPGQPRVNYRKTNNDIVTYNPNSDNNSLVYGKYFIVVFNFITDKQIKMEEIFISTSKY